MERISSSRLSFYHSVSIQNFIDRRFYRRNYDAEKALAEFASVARRETELDLLSSKMMQVANESLQPEFSQLWLVRKKY